MFFYANGCLSVAVGAFRNQMVFHNLDNMSSLMLHVFPMLSMWNMRWYTMPYEATKPEKDRRFLSPDESFDSTKFFLVPFLFYLAWVSVYFMIHFVFAKDRIVERNYETMFRAYER